MLKNIKINLEAIEAMLYYWHVIKDKEKVPEKFIYDIVEMNGLKDAYDEEFDSESVRRVLSAIKNREIFTSRTPKEGRFWNNNLWMLEDLNYTDDMVAPLKKLNVNDITENIDEDIWSKNDKEFEVIFAPLHVDDYVIKDNKLIINFFKIKPQNDVAFLGEQELKAFIGEKLLELLKKKNFIE